ADSLAGPGAAGERPTQQIFDYRLVESDAGVKQWILQSEEMRKYGGQRDMVLSEVHMDFFQDGAHFSVLVADSGTANTVTKQVFTWGNVVVTTDDGRRLETEELHFDDKSGLIHNDVFNRFTRRADVMTGFGLEATPDLEYIELKRDVKAAVTDTTDLARPAPGSGKEGP
ncbi:LPS export ABC transporter periplasmic protein LptC, partial [bacterium]|nr:LPS export ABC transporter periplasmic protein LptC [bacterium]